MMKKAASSANLGRRAGAHPLLMQGRRSPPQFGGQQFQFRVTHGGPPFERKEMTMTSRQVEHQRFALAVDADKHDGCDILHSGAIALG